MRLELYTVVGDPSEAMDVAAGAPVHLIHSYAEACREAARRGGVVVTIGFDLVSATSEPVDDFRKRSAA